MVLRYATPQEIDAWDSFVHDNFLQGHSFARVKSNRWKPIYLMAPQRTGILMLTRKVPFVGTLAYIPAGPNARAAQSLEALIHSLKLFLKIHHPDIFLLKLEPRTTVHDFSDEGLFHTSSIQPDATIILPVTTDLSHIGRRARRYIRTGEREGVDVKIATPTHENILTMYQLMGSAYGGRGMPGLRPFSYYEKFWTLFHQAHQGDLYFAYHKNIPVAGVFVVKMGKTAVYKDGGSLHGRESKGATYFIHWKIMQDLAAEGFDNYDLWGSPPSSHIDDSKHPLHGLASFKTAFSSIVTDYPGVYDMVLHAHRYTKWRRVYPLLRRYLLVVKKEGFY